MGSLVMGLWNMAMLFLSALFSLQADVLFDQEFTVLIPEGFPIIDPHIHQWHLMNTPRILSWPKRLLGWNKPLYETVVTLGASKADKDYVGGISYVGYDYLPENYATDRGQLNISHVVHVEAGWQDTSDFGPVKETQWAASLFSGRTDPSLGGIVGRLDLRGSNVDAVLAAHKRASSKLVGIRQMLAWDADKSIMRFCDQPKLSEDSKWRAGFDVLATHDLSFDAWFFHHQLDEMVVLANAYPETTFILGHMGTPIGLGGEFASYGGSDVARSRVLGLWQEGMARVAECPNVLVKLSGFFMPVVGWGYHLRDQQPCLAEVVDDLRPMVEFVVGQFGVDRCMFASNFPMDKVSMSLGMLYDVYWSLCEGFGDEDRVKLFRDNARDCYKIEG